MAPIEMTLNGIASTVSYAGGYPGTSAAYQVNFEVPAGLGKGVAVLRWSVAWIPGVDVSIAVE